MLWRKETKMPQGRECSKESGRKVRKAEWSRKQGDGEGKLEEQKDKEQKKYAQCLNERNK